METHSTSASFHSTRRLFTRLIALRTTQILPAIVLLLAFGGFSPAILAADDAQGRASGAEGRMSGAAKAPPVAPAAATPQSDPLADFLRSLDPRLQQAMSDSLLIYRNAPRITKAIDKKRVIFGEPTTPLHLIEWTDIRCPHCKHLEDALTEMRRVAPVGSWSEEARHFPLDSECNPHAQRSDGSGVSCLAAKLQICLVGDAKEFNRVRSTMFKEQRTLTRDRIWQITTSDARQRKKLEECVKSPQTAKILREDIDYAIQHKLEGTPLVVINNRKATPLPAMIYTMIMVMGRDNDPGFKVLPPPNTQP